MTERDLQDAVIEAARLLGWYVHHTRPAMTGRGWRTPIQGDVGFPDLILVRDRVVALELKVGGRRTTPEQDAWLAAFHDAGCHAVVVTDRMWLAGDIDHILTAPPSPSPPPPPTPTPTPSPPPSPAPTPTPAPSPSPAPTPTPAPSPPPSPPPAPAPTPSPPPAPAPTPPSTPLSPKGT